MFFFRCCHVQPFPPAAAAAANANLAGLVSNANPSLSVQSAVVAAPPFPVQPSQGVVFILLKFRLQLNKS